jgi:hypothetical protein
MAGYRVGTQEWYDATRKRLVTISSELCKSDINQNRRNELYTEQADLVESLMMYSNENHVNNPIV